MITALRNTSSSQKCNLLRDGHIEGLRKYLLKYLIATVWTERGAL